MSNVYSLASNIILQVKIVCDAWLPQKEFVILP